MINSTQFVILYILIKKRLNQNKPISNSNEIPAEINEIVSTVNMLNNISDMKLINLPSFTEFLSKKLPFDLLIYFTKIVQVQTQQET